MTLNVTKKSPSSGLKLQQDGARQRRIGPRGVTQLLEHLPALATKLSLDLAGTGLTERGVAALATCLRPSLLDLNLNLGHCSVQAEGCSILGRSLPPTLSSLSMAFRSCPRLHQGGAVLLSAGIARLNLDTLNLDFSGCGLRDEGVRRMAQNLPSSLCSLSLDLGGCPMTEQAAMVLLAKCAGLSNLRQLQLSTFGCPIGDFAIPSAFSPNFKRLTLNFSGSSVGDKLACSLGCCFPTLLEQLELTLISTSVTDAGITGIASLADGLTGLQSLGLDLSGCRISDGGIRTLVERLPTSLVHLALGVAGCEVTDVCSCGLTSWKEHMSTLVLDLGETKLCDKDLEELLLGARKLRQLSLNCSNSRVTCASTSLAAAVGSLNRPPFCDLRLDLTGCCLSSNGLQGMLAECPSQYSTGGIRIVHNQTDASMVGHAQHEAVSWKGSHLFFLF